MTRVTGVRLVAVVMAMTLVLAACGGSDSEQGQEQDQAAPTSVRLITHDSFDLSPEVLAAFEQRTGITVELLAGGDAVSVVNQAILTAGNPVADVLFGIDNNQLAAAFEAGVFEAYTPADIGLLRPGLTDGTDGLVTPVDVGDVCVNYDREWFAERGLTPPSTLNDLADPAYANLLVVQNPASSSPGLAFLLATVAAFGEDGYQGFWDQLVGNGVVVTEGWEQAYYDGFSGGSGEGDRPLVVSYATSPPAEVFYAENFDAGALPEVGPTGVAADTCYRQVEYAGILAGGDNTDAARQLVDFLISPEVQADVPLTMFVEPARSDVPLPEVFVRYSAEPGEVWSLTPDEVAAGRTDWVAQWRRIVLG
jgi:thiamine transport system substrate-binding protein